MGVGVYQHICRSVSSSSLNSFHIAAGDHQLIGRTGMTQTVKHDTRELRVCILPFEELLADQYRLHSQTVGQTEQHSAVTVQPGEYRSFTLKLAADADHHTSLTYAPYTSELTLDRSYAGSRADIVHRRSCKVRSQNGALKLRILLDKNSIEVFANDGEQTMTAWIYTPQSADGITFAADGKATITAEQFELDL